MRNRGPVEQPVPLNTAHISLIALGREQWTLGEVDSAVALFRRAVALQPRFYQAHAFLCSVFMSQNRYQEAIAACTAALKYYPRNATFIQGRAIASRLLVQEQLGERFFPDLHESGVNNAAVSNAANSDDTVDDSLLLPSHSNYIYCPKQQFIYAPVPKVACSSLKWFIYELLNETVDGLPKFHKHKLDANLHMFIDHGFPLSAFGNTRIKTLLRHNDVFKFGFVRNPFQRIVSAYLNKFVINRSNPEQLEHAFPVIQAIFGDSARPDSHVSFRQFVEYLANEQDDNLDKHWIPQFRLLDPRQLDFVGKFENIDVDFSYVCKRINLPPRALPHLNRTPMTRVKGGPGSFADTTSEELAKTQSVPNLIQFYDKAIERSVVNRFSTDFELFGYDTQICEPNGSL